MESIVQCPACGENVTLVLVKEDFPMADMLRDDTGLMITPDCFGSKPVTCACGSRVIATLTVTALDV